MRHQDLTLIHRLESFVYADAAARTGATGFVPGDVGRIAYQTDNKSYWRLTSDSPVVWSPIAIGFASLQVAPATPSGTTSTTVVMMGMGSTWKITPIATGKILAMVTGMLKNAVASTQTSANLSYGTVASGVPANGAAQAGTIIGSTIVSHQALASGFSPTAWTAVITGLTVGTQYWIDIGLVTAAGGTATAGNLAISAVEIP